MKNVKQILGAIAMMLFTFNFLSAQSPHKFTYQAVIRNSNFELIKNAAVSMRVSVLQGSATGTAVYVETFTPTTNANGMVTVDIGGGTKVSGDFTTINWGTGAYFIKTETDPAGGTNYSITGTTQFMSVPYAMYANNSGSSTPGPQGPAGPAGPQGPKGDPGLLTVNCLQCHNHDKNSATYKGSFAEKKQMATDAYPFSMHNTGEAYLLEGTSTSCSPCHADAAYNYIVKNNIKPTYTYNSTTGKYTFAFSVDPSVSSTNEAIPGKISCYTCHKSNANDSMAFLFKDTVKLTLRSFPGREKFYFNANDNGQSNLCVSCHQARPFNQNTTSGDGSSMNFEAMAAAPADTMYWNTKSSSTGNKYSFSRTFVGHYGWVGNVNAGKGYAGIELPGSVAYTNSAHTNTAGCAMCHMASGTVVNGEPAGSHTFSAIGNYRGCNVTDCHGSAPLSATSSKVTGALNTNRANVDTLGELLKSQGQYMIERDTLLDAEGKPENRWYKWSTKHFSGYLNIGTTPGTFVATNGTVPAGQYKWPTLTNGQFAALQVMTVCLREGSGGIHNTKYTNALLRNAIEYLRANPIL